MNSLEQLSEPEEWRNVQRDDIFHTLDVLSGRVNASYTMKFQVPFAFSVSLVRDAFNNLKTDVVYMESIKKNLESQLKNNELTDDDVSTLQKKCDTNKSIVTILDLLSSQIKIEINALDILNNRIVFRKHYPAFFPTELMRDEKLSMSRIVRLIDYYLGYDYFNIFCLFNSGTPYLSLLP